VIIMNCPSCKRPTRRRKDAHRNRPGWEPDELVPGTVRAELTDGTCNACYRTGSRYIPQVSPALAMPRTVRSNEVREDELLEAEQWFSRYVEDRRRRGVDPEGIKLGESRRVK
jgi:hypothetical protein